MRKQQFNLGLIALLMVGIMTCGMKCASLSSTGPYKGDKVLYNADLVLTTSYSVIHQFVQFEKDNRASLATTPEVKQVADSLRVKAPIAYASAIAARDVYVSSKTSANASALTTAIEVLQSLAVSATTQLTKLQTTTK